MVIFIVFMSLVNLEYSIILNYFRNFLLLLKIFMLILPLIRCFRIFKRKFINSSAKFIFFPEIEIKMNHLNILWLTIFVNSQNKIFPIFFLLFWTIWPYTNQIKCFLWMKIPRKILLDQILNFISNTKFNKFISKWIFV